MNRVRFAPSPTGYLHLGHAFSALTGYRRALEAGGKFILRIEDIDIGRARAECEQAIYEDLAWLGIRWEVPVRRQGGDLPLYRDAVAGLAGQGLTYPCFCSRKTIADAAVEEGPEGPIYPGICRQLSAGERREMIEAGHPPPEFKATPHSFTVTLSNARERAAVPRWTRNMNERQTKAVAYVNEQGSISNREYRAICPGVSSETLRLDLLDLVERGLLLKIGSKKGTHYILK